MGAHGECAELNASFSAASATSAAAASTAATSTAAASTAAAASATAVGLQGFTPRGPSGEDRGWQPATSAVVLRRAAGYPDCRDVGHAKSSFYGLVRASASIQALS